jgi:hypothetical protein
VAEGDRIRTGSGGLAYLTFFEGVEIEILDSTLMVVSTLVLPDSDDVAFDISVDVLVGTTISTIDAILDPDDRFEVHTPNATVAVRGTRWWTIVLPTGETAFATERGEVTVIPHGRSDEAAGGTATAPAPVPDEEDTTQEPAMSAIPAPEMESLEAGSAFFASQDGTVTEFLADVTFPERPARASIVVSLVAADCGNGICRLGEAESCPVDCLDQVTFPGCGDGVCAVEQGEDLLVCATDCGPWPGDSCGDGTCDADESGLTCPSDCARDRYFGPVRPEDCGNNTCDPTESGLTCPSDCALSLPEDRCGNGICGLGENRLNCPADCAPGGPPAPVPPEEICGNGVCGRDEDTLNCPADCAPGEPPTSSALTKSAGTACVCERERPGLSAGLRGPTLVPPLWRWQVRSARNSADLPDRLQMIDPVGE